MSASLLRPATVALVATAALAFAVLAVPASADRGHRSPRITSLGFTDQVHHRKEAWLEVISHDNDGRIVHVQVLWGDNSFTQADTFCVQGRRMGKRAVVKIPHTYRKAGRYTVAVRVQSARTCASGSRHQTGPERHLRVRVR